MDRTSPTGRAVGRVVVHCICTNVSSLVFGGISNHSCLPIQRHRSCVMQCKSFCRAGYSHKTLRSFQHVARRQLNTQKRHRSLRNIIKSTLASHPASHSTHQSVQLWPFALSLPLVLSRNQPVHRQPPTPFSQSRPQLLSLAAFRSSTLR